MKTIILGCILTVLGSINSYQRCSVDYNWKPFNGTIPSGAFVGGFDSKKNPTYIAKIVTVNDGSMWTTPVQLYQGKKYIDFAWFKSEDIMRIDKFIDILVPDEYSTLKWINVENGENIEIHLENISEKCCLVEGGIGVLSNHVYISYIGKVMPDGETSYIGRLYKDTWQGVHIMHGTNSTKVYDDIQVLTYGCQDYNKVIALESSKL